MVLKEYLMGWVLDRGMKPIFSSPSYLCSDFPFFLFYQFLPQANALKITTSTPEMNKLAHSLSRLAGDDMVWTDNDGSFIRRRRINL